MKNYEIAQLDEVESTQCPCGTTKRAFVSPENPVATIHIVDISKDSRVHYHKKLTEIYLVLEGEGHMDLDGELVPVKPMTTILINPVVGIAQSVRCALLIFRSRLSTQKTNGLITKQRKQRRLMQ